MTAQTPTGRKTYKAFEARGKGDDGEQAGTSVNRTLEPEDSMEIRQVLAPWVAPEWKYYMIPIYNGAFPDKLGLVYSFLTVKIEGERLLPLLRAIKKKTCIYIQEFDAQEFLRPEPGQTIIKKITVKFRKGGDEDEIINSMPENRIRIVPAEPESADLVD